ncbi:MAG: type III-B CRISPR-associated protein Cas10/Cmr2 [bacterium]
MSKDIFEKLSKKFGNDKNLYLLNVSIGPVQEFIKEARKTKDLWTGSYLLSQIAYQTMRPILEHFNKDVFIYPRIENSASTSQFSKVPNHFLAIVDDVIISKFKNNEIQKPVYKYWSDLSKNIYDYIAEKNNKKFKWNENDLWNKQINDCFQIYWVAKTIKLSDLKGNYIETHNNIQQFMEERKLTRTFNQWDGNSAFKCPQCGHREIIGPIKDNKNFWEELRKDKKIFFKIKENEKLCAVCLVKRFVEDKIPFESSSDIASKNFKDFLIGKKIDEEINNFLTNIKKLFEILNIEKINSISEIPGDWLYEERFNFKKLEKEFPHVRNTKIIDTLKALKENLKESKEKYKISPQKYYVLLMMDGDKIGDLMSRKDIYGQIACSDAIGELGNKILPDIIYRWGGYPVYSGGDDLLAFGPIEKSISTAFKLQKSFSEKLETTCSISLVIVHYQDSLRRAMEECRQSLESAKEHYGRNSLCITLMLSSGTLTSGGCKWYLPIYDFSVGFTDFMNNLIKWMGKEKDGLSSSFIYDILKELPAFYKFHKNIQPYFSIEMFESEITRLLDRHIPEESFFKTAPDYKKKSEIFVKIISSLGDPKYINKFNGWRTDIIDTKDNLESILRICAFLNREGLKEI